MRSPVETYDHKFKVRPVKKVVCYSLTVKKLRIRIIGIVADYCLDLGAVVRSGCLCRDKLDQIRGHIGEVVEKARVMIGD